MRSLAGQRKDRGMKMNMVIKEFYAGEDVPYRESAFRAHSVGRQRNDAGEAVIVIDALPEASRGGLRVARLRATEGVKAVLCNGAADVGGFEAGGPCGRRVRVLAWAGGLGPGARQSRAVGAPWHGAGPARPLRGGRPFLARNKCDLTCYIRA